MKAPRGVYSDFGIGDSFGPYITPAPPQDRPYITRTPSQDRPYITRTKGAVS